MTGKITSLLFYTNSRLCSAIGVRPRCSIYTNTHFDILSSKSMLHIIIIKKFIQLCGVMSLVYDMLLAATLLPKSNQCCSNPWHFWGIIWAQVIPMHCCCTGQALFIWWASCSAGPHLDQQGAFFRHDDSSGKDDNHQQESSGAGVNAAVTAIQAEINVLHWQGSESAGLLEQDTNDSSVKNLMKMLQTSSECFLRWEELQCFSKAWRGHKPNWLTPKLSEPSGVVHFRGKLEGLQQCKQSPACSSFSLDRPSTVNNGRRIQGQWVGKQMMHGNWNQKSQLLLIDVKTEEEVGRCISWEGFQCHNEIVWSCLYKKIL